MVSRDFDFRSHDHKTITDRILYNGFRFVDMTFNAGDPKKDKVMHSLSELMKKLAKVVNEWLEFQTQKHAFEERILHDFARNIDSIPTLELQQIMENFLTQAKGALDIFATQFLKAMFDYSYDKWNHTEITKCLEGQRNVDEEVMEAIRKFLSSAWNDWLKDFISDRNLHHEANLGLSGMSIVDGKPFLKLTRRNGDEVTDVVSYLTTHLQKVFWLIENMIRLCFCALRPDLKIIFTAEFKSCLDSEQIET